jgi:chromate reductase
MDAQISVLGFAGSLRKQSYNRALISTARELCPPGMTIEIFELNEIPPFNQEAETQMPVPVKLFKEKIKAADALLIATPEHNYSIPGVLKNAMDWASRPYGDNSFEGKPVAIMSASTGMLGGARAQYHLRQTFVFLNMHPLNKPEVFITFAAQKFDANGRLNDDTARKLIKDLLNSLARWTLKLK